MTKQDWTPLPGDHGCDERMDEWAEDMSRRLNSLPPTTQRQLWKEMTDEEKDAIRTYRLSQVKRWFA
jgi:hypothetical protein